MIKNNRKRRKLLTENSDEVVKVILKKYGLNHGRFIINKYKSHPLYPGFKAISYIMEANGIESCLIKTDINELGQLPMPIIVEYDGLFLPIGDVKEKKRIGILNERGEMEYEPLSMLESLWSRTAMVFNADNIKQYRVPVNKIIRDSFNRCMIYVLLASSLLLYITGVSLCITKFSTISNVFLCVSIIGVFICVLFQVLEFDRSNPIINNICHSKSDIKGKKDCSSILDSQASTFHGLFSWADCGLAYFVFFAILPIIVTESAYSSFLGLISLLASCYVPYSLIYQFFYAKKICVLCISIQVLLLVNMVLSIIGIGLGIVSFGNLSGIDLVTIAVTGLLCIAIITVAKVIGKNAYHNQKKAKQLLTLKHYPLIENTILSERRRIDCSDLDTISISVGESHVITMIVNPTCSPCMRMARTLLDIIKNKRDTQVDLIFLVDINDSESFHIASYFMSCYKKGHWAFLKLFTSYVNNFPASRKEIPSVHDDDEAKEIIVNHCKWCHVNGIVSTPKLFIDTKELPQLYDVNDIDYMVE